MKVSQCLFFPKKMKLNKTLDGLMCRLVCVRDSPVLASACWRPARARPLGPDPRASRSRSSRGRHRAEIAEGWLSRPRVPVVGWLGFPVRSGLACKAVSLTGALCAGCMIRITTDMDTRLSRRPFLYCTRQWREHTLGTCLVPENPTALLVHSENIIESCGTCMKH